MAFVIKPIHLAGYEKQVVKNLSCMELHCKPKINCGNKVTNLTSEQAQALKTQALINSEKKA